MPINPALKQLDEKLLGRIPLVIGVTGHRDLYETDDARLKDEFTRALERLKRDYLDRDPDTPIVILSALAEGADSLVAEAALEQGAILIAPLPMEKDEYLEDFKPGKAIRADAEKRFESLLTRAFATIEMPYCDGGTRESVRNDRKKRDAQYQDVGLYIVNHCHVLVALWNGDQSGELTGGAAQIVRFKRNGIPFELSKDARNALDGSEIGPVIEIMAPRKKAGSPQVAIETRPWGFDLTGPPLRGPRRIVRDSVDFIRIFFGLHPEGHSAPPEIRGWNVFRATTGQTRRFNREGAARAASPKGRRAFEKSLAGVFTDYADAASPDRRAMTAPIPEPGKDVQPVHLRDIQANALEKAGRWCEAYRRADALALTSQHSFRSDWFKLFLAGFVAIMFFEAYAHLCPHPALLLLYIATLVYGFSLFIRARVRHHQERFLDYRSLAEALRVALYWRVARIENHVASAYPIKQPSELAWVTIVVRTLDMLDDAVGPALAPADRQSFDDVRRLWIVGQWAYFTRRSRELTLLAEMREEWSLVALAASPLVGAVGLAILYLLIEDAHAREEARHVMIVIMGLLVGAGAVIAGYTEQLAFKAQGRQYERMYLLFERALLLVNTALNAHPDRATSDDIRQLKELYIELGREAMKENAEWVAIYRQRPIRPAG
ncbi:MAG: hypothetical protein WDO17_01785 [Alphaproteobacteria bacterium]